MTHQTPPPARPITLTIDDLTVSISRARYAKNSIAVHCPSDGGFKTREMRVVEALNGRWSNRERAYILAATKEPRLRQLLADGWDGKLSFIGDGYRTKMILQPPRSHDTEPAEAND